MPIYEYRCVACGDEFETLVVGGAAVTCPACSSAQVARRLSLFGLGRPATAAGAGRGGGCACGTGGCGCR